jgi:hypothetical protein
MNRLIGERDWPAQEVYHLLLDFPLQDGTRVVINVDCRSEDDQGMTYAFTEDGTRVKRGDSPLEMYKQRSDNLEDITYLECLQYYDYRKKDNIYRRQKAPARV